MLVDKSELMSVLQGKMKTFACKKEWSDNLSSFLFEKHGVSRGETMDAIRNQKDLNDYSETFLFFLCEGMYSVQKSKNLNPKLYFTEMEINEYSDTYIQEKNEIEFPLVLYPVVQIENNQWITNTNVSFLYRLKQSRLINYNINTQRNMTKSIKGGKEIYKINLNKKSVKSIKDSMIEGKFIPNTITLNIPENQGDFVYDSEKMTLTINSLEHFDIIDGYHRYMAMCSAKEKDENFSYNMELRIVNFSEVKCKNFIFQEDQRNQMKKIESKSFDMYDVGNIITQKLDEDPLSILNNCIKRNSGLMKQSDVSECIRYYMCKNINISQRNIFIINTTKYIESCFEKLVQHNTKYIDGTFTYDFVKLNILFYIFSEYLEEGFDEVAIKEIENMLEHKNELDKTIFYRTTIKKINENKLATLRKKVNDNV